MIKITKKIWKTLANVVSIITLPIGWNEIVKGMTIEGMVIFGIGILIQFIKYYSEEEK